ncbi:MAG TPA: hypothetical protein VGH54_05225, partial [Mycobacterium sp.]
MTNIGHRAGLLTAIGGTGPHGPGGGIPGGNPAGPGADGCPAGGVSDMKRWYRRSAIPVFSLQAARLE